MKKTKIIAMTFVAATSAQSSPLSKLPSDFATSVKTITNADGFVLKQKEFVVEEYLDLDKLVAELSENEDFLINYNSASTEIASEFEIGNKPTLRSIRLANGLSQTQFAELLSMKQPNISAYESGARMPTMRTVRKMSKLLKVNVGTIVEAMNREKSYHG